MGSQALRLAKENGDIQGFFGWLKCLLFSSNTFASLGHTVFFIILILGVTVYYISHINIMSDTGVKKRNKTRLRSWLVDSVIGSRDFFLKNLTNFFSLLQTASMPTQPHFYPILGTSLPSTTGQKQYWALACTKCDAWPTGGL